MVNGVSAGGITYFTVAYVLAAVATVAVILRFVARWKTRVRADKSGVQTGIRADDWSIAASLPLYWALAVQANLWATKGKIGFPTRELSPGQLEYFFEIFFANQVTYSCVCPVIKIAVLQLYRRIFWAFEFVRWPIRITEALVIAWGVAVLLVSIFQCSPVRKFWSPTIPGHCIDSQSFFWGNSISNLLLDVIILCLPAYPVFAAAMRWQKKMLVMGVFLLGSFVCVASILRIVELGVIKDIDVALTLASAATWTTVEPGVGIISACLPCYWVWAKRYISSKARDSAYDAQHPKHASSSSASHDVKRPLSHRFEQLEDVEMHDYDQQDPTTGSKTHGTTKRKDGQG